MCLVRNVRIYYLSGPSGRYSGRVPLQAVAHFPARVPPLVHNRLQLVDALQPDNVGAVVHEPARAWRPVRLFLHQRLFGVQFVAHMLLTALQVFQMGVGAALNLVYWAVVPHYIPRRLRTGHAPCTGVTCTYMFGALLTRKELSDHSSKDSKLTWIHGKFYDLQDFVHPGGGVALWHTLGRDDIEVICRWTVRNR